MRPGVKYYEEGLAALSAVDVELGSAICAAVARQAEKLGKVCLVSHHDFEKTPPLAELESIVERAQQNGAVAKVATMIRSEADVDILARVAAQKKETALVRHRHGRGLEANARFLPETGLLPDLRLSGQTHRARADVSR